MRVSGTSAGFSPLGRKPTATMDAGWLRRAIETKRDGGPVDAATWRRIIAAYMADEIDDAPVAALAMACAIRGMADDEIFALTDAMVASGDVLTFAGEGVVVDKHSSGGVGDTVSLVVVPLVAACGIRVAKLSGRALGHTGGTLDKLEAIPGVRTDLSPAAFADQIERIGCAIAAQSARLVPADKRLYALRDRTGSVPSIGLIAASIVSKKIAGGAHAIVFDVKVGSGAFMRTTAKATELAATMVRLANRSGRRASALVTDMNEPLAANIGTGVEAIEARDFLRGRLPASRFGDLTRLVAGEMLRVAGVPEADVASRIETALASGAGYERFVQLIEAQGGVRATFEALAPLQPRTPVRTSSDGFVTAIDTVAIGEAARELTERSGPLAGIRIITPVGTQVRAGDRVADVGGAVEAEALARLGAAFSIGDVAPPPRPLAGSVIRDASAAPPSNPAR
jgi:pyrimidine-nucleoside phosphorylase